MDNEWQPCDLLQPPLCFAEHVFSHMEYLILLYTAAVNAQA